MHRFKNIVSIDCETSGYNKKAIVSPYEGDIATGYQAVSWGLVISTPDTFKPIDQLYVEVKWNGKAKWSPKAEQVHGLSKEYLEENGVTEEEAAVDILEFLMKNLDISEPIYFLGQNAPSFDVIFFKDLLRRYDVKNIIVSSRCFDTFALSAGTIQKYKSDSMFKKVGLKERKKHNSLEDALYALETYRRINLIWKKMLEKS
jgi:DNA polymerase III epsilon subunit-like protein